MKTFFLRLLALLLIAGGIWGLGKWRFDRKYYRATSVSLTGATPKQIDELYAEALVGRALAGAVTRTSAQAGRLDFHTEGDSWNEASTTQTAMEIAVRQAATARGLTIQVTSYGNRGINEPKYLAGKRLRFLASAAVMVFGIALMVLSLRFFGGGSAGTESPA